MDNYVSLISVIIMKYQIPYRTIKVDSWYSTTYKHGQERFYSLEVTTDWE